MDVSGALGNRAAGAGSCQPFAASRSVLQSRLPWPPLPNAAQGRSRCPGKNRRGPRRASCRSLGRCFVRPRSPRWARRSPRPLRPPLRNRRRRPARPRPQPRPPRAQQQSTGREQLPAASFGWPGTKCPTGVETSRGTPALQGQDLHGAGNGASRRRRYRPGPPAVSRRRPDPPEQGAVPHEHRQRHPLAHPAAGERRQPGQRLPPAHVFSRPGDHRALGGLRADRRQGRRRGGPRGGELHRRCTEQERWGLAIQPGRPRRHQRAGLAGHGPERCQDGGAGALGTRRGIQGGEQVARRGRQRTKRQPLFLSAGRPGERDDDRRRAPGPAAPRGQARRSHDDRRGSVT